jgi:hypothetical protein
MKQKIFAIIGAVIVITLIALSGRLIEDADKSKNYVCQLPASGKYIVWTEGGLQWQLLGNVEEYAKTSQIEFSDLHKNERGYVASGDNPAAGTTFNDRGKGYIIGSFRVVLPTDDQNMMAIQRDYGSEKALINNLVKPTLYKVVTACGPLMSSLESVSETRTDLTAYITDQLNNGVYKTKTSKVKVINEITGEEELRTQAELIPDENAPGGYVRQEKSPFSQYGITAGIVSIIDIKYDAATQQQIDAQKAANLSVITAKTQALEAMQKAITIEEQGKAAAAKAKWDQEKEKAIAVTKAEQEREVARLAAEKAEFQKKEIIAKGQAEAEANRLKVNAGLTPQERAEWEYKTAVGIAEALANSKVRWVPEVIMSGNNGSNSAMDAVGLNMMMDVVKKMNNQK